MSPPEADSHTATVSPRSFNNAPKDAAREDNSGMITSLMPLNPMPSRTIACMINRVVHLTGSTQKEQRWCGNIVTTVGGSHQHPNRPARLSKWWWAKVLFVACT
jgi:hypothetical protein